VSPTPINEPWILGGDDQEVAVDIAGPEGELGAVARAAFARDGLADPGSEGDARDPLVLDLSESGDRTDGRENQKEEDARHGGPVRQGSVPSGLLGCRRPDCCPQMLRT
jgi:hypothetical protein